jgi:hypothetical protein
MVIDHTRDVSGSVEPRLSWCASRLDPVTGYDACRVTVDADQFQVTKRKTGSSRGQPARRTYETSDLVLSGDGRKRTRIISDHMQRPPRPPLVPLRKHTFERTFDIDAHVQDDSLGAPTGIPGPDSLRRKNPAYRRVCSGEWTRLLPVTYALRGSPSSFMLRATAAYLS